MSFIDSITETLGFQITSKRPNTDTEYGGYFTNSHNMENMDGDINIREAKRCSAFRGAVHIISRSIGEVTFACDNKRLNKLFERPNDWQTGQEFFEAVAHDILFYGEAMIELIGANPERPLMLTTHDPSKVKIKVENGKPYYVIPLDDNRRINTDRMIRIRDMSTSSIRTESRLYALRYQVKALNKSAILSNTTLNNSLNVSYVLSSPGTLEKKTRDANDKIFKAFMSADENTSTLVQLENGMTLNTVPAVAPIDAPTLATLHHYINEIASSFGVPSWLIGGPVNSKYNNMNQQIQHMNRNAISPLLGKISKAFTVKLGVTVTYDDSILLRGDSYAMGQMYLQQLQAGAITPNEFREAVGWDRCDMEGADELRPIKLPVSSNSPGGTDSDQQTNPPERQTNPPTIPSDDPEG